MDDKTQNKSWAKTLELYDSLLKNGWPHVPGFRNLVATLASSQEAWGLTAFTSHETLIVSPYTRYPDKLDERHVSVHTLSDGTVRIEKIPAVLTVISAKCGPCHYTVPRQRFAN